MSARIIPIRKPALPDAVVFAMQAQDVQADAWGFSCLLWGPACKDPERLRHCRLAVRQGMAEGFLLYGEGEGESASEGELLSLRVLKRGKEYWAKWGGMARNIVPQGRERAAGASL